ncbi:hypothetical protein GCM10027598_02450 [Amycolatopsis oliviviridis]|uniref:Secreted protein n=1 Tax=Amycolatopsis oliviviridis TaxID=1471590 RepID=A0ABQ3LJQ8_9PSEU|nr:hypothetical protein GCM10017790_35840 [Amycolatopsis oliviviridis]
MPAARAIWLVVTPAPCSTISGSTDWTIILRRSSGLIPGALRRVGVSVMLSSVRSEYSLRQLIKAEAREGPLPLGF